MVLAISNSALITGAFLLITDYTVYKGRGAMTVKVIKPTWERTTTGNGLKIARVGSLLLEFANSKG